MRSPIYCLALLFSLLPLGLVAQNRLVRADDAVELQRVWTWIGESEEQIGLAVAALPDISGDGIGDLAVYRGDLTNEWFFFRGGTPPEEMPFHSVEQTSHRGLLVGNFLGGEQQYLILNRVYAPVRFKVAYVRELLPVNRDIRTVEPILSFDPGTSDTSIYLSMQKMTAADVDNNGASDFIMHINGLYRGTDGLFEGYPRLWIHLGGADFDFSEPDIIFVDTGKFGLPNRWDAQFADLDGDGRTDMIYAGDYTNIGPQISFYFGDEESPQSWVRDGPDRVIRPQGDTVLNGLLFLLFDVDGDAVTDFGTYRFGSPGESFIFLTSSGKSTATRSFTSNDADLHILDPTSIALLGAGFFNDSSRTYEMAPFSLENRTHLFVSGKTTGPDLDYEAFYDSQSDGFFEPIGSRAAVGDVTGDGYDDLILGQFFYGTANRGVAAVIAGGSHIPLDDPTVGVRHEPVAGEPQALSYWPNPVVDRLHLAWRAGLPSLPHRIRIYAIDGRLVLDEAVDPRPGTVVWECAGVEAGSYRIVLIDRDERSLGSVQILKQP